MKSTHLVAIPSMGPGLVVNWVTSAMTTIAVHGVMVCTVSARPATRLLIEVRTRSNLHLRCWLYRSDLSGCRLPFQRTILELRMGWFDVYWMQYYR